MDVERGSDYVLVRGLFRVLSSAAYNGGYRAADAIVNIQVPKDFNSDYQGIMREFSVRLSLKDFVGLLTAAPVAKSAILAEGGVTVIVSAGLGGSLSKGTINTIVIAERDLTEAAMANLLMVATEAKAAAFHDLDIRGNGGPATGTVTDAVAIASAGGPHAEFAGPATEIGRTVRGLVLEGTKAALASMEGVTPSRPPQVRLEERGIDLGSLTHAALMLWEPTMTDEGERQDVARRFEESLQRHLTDVNVAAFLEAAFLLEDALRARRLPVTGDPVHLMADDILGLTLAEYLAGTRAVFNFERYDHAKPGILATLGPFLDDILAGLIAGTMTRSFEP